MKKLERITTEGLTALLEELYEVEYHGISNNWDGVRIRVKPTIDYRGDRWTVSMSNWTYQKLINRRGVKAITDEFR